MSESGVFIPPWAGRRRADALAWVKDNGRRKELPCVICRQGIDYSLEYPHKQSCSVQHIKSRNAYPQLTWERSNWAPAHLDCNIAAGTSSDTGLGVMSEAW